ncbi:MAG: BatA domain-containing protein [Bacteroidia bacterium]|nr:BatA domain-containing protein [Bacteroidia bacterium]
MSFLNPSILWGLLALAVPIIIHFFNLQRPRQILFSNVAFVKEVQKNVVRKIKLRQWLLLLARCIAVAAAVLAFAHPVWVSKQSKMLKGNRSVAIIVDNSSSMTAGNEKGAYLQQAVSLSKSIINTYTQQDEFLLLTTGNLRMNSNFSEKEQTLEELQKISIQQKICSENTILNGLEKIFSRSNNIIKEVYFLSDFQESTVLADTQQLKLNLDSATLVKFIPLATREQNNLYLTSHKLNSQIIEKNKPVQLTFTVVNDGEKEAKDLGIRVNVSDKVVAIATQTVSPKSSQEVALTFTPTESGWQSGYIEIEDNPIVFDNQRYFSFFVPDKEPVLVVEGMRSQGVHILYQDLFTQFTPSFISDKAISGVQLSDYKSIILTGISDVSSGLSEKLRTYLQEGGGVMLFPGDNTNLTNMNAFLEGIGVGKFGELVSSQSGNKASQADLQHPVFDGVFAQNQKNRTLDAPMIFRYYPLSLNNGTIQSRILSLENQNPVLVQSKIGKGTLMLWTTFPGDAWTDLHVKTLFTPIMYRATQMISRTTGGSANQELGKYEPLAVRTPKQDMIKLKGVTNLEYIPEQYVQNDVTVLNFEKLDMKEGNYKIIQGETELDRISFNISDTESRLSFTDKDALETSLEKKGLSQVQVLSPEPSAITRTIQVEKEGTPLWKWFVIMALIALIAEVIILRFRDGSWTKKKETT